MHSYFQKRVLVHQVNYLSELSQCVSSQTGQLSLAVPSCIGAVSTSDRHTVRSTSLISVVSQCRLVSGWALRKRKSAPLCGPHGLRRAVQFFLRNMQKMTSWDNSRCVSVSFLLHKVTRVEFSSNKMITIITILLSEVWWGRTACY